jgi:hypothetical protein
MRPFWVALVLLFPSVTAAQTRDPLAGAWELTASKNLTTGAVNQITTPPLRVIYADGYYVQFTAAAGREKGTTPTAKMTREQLLDRLRLQGQYGTYRVDGKNLVRRTIAAASPNNEGRELTSEFRVEGDELIIIRTQAAQGAQGEGQKPQKIEDRYRRLKGGK